MSDHAFKRKLTAIFSADVVGYSRLMAEDEAATVTLLEDYKRVLFHLIEHFRGRLIDAIGDNLLAEFSSIIDAVACAVDIQKELKTRNDSLPKNRRMAFRIGINLGDVIEKDERIYGDGVNIAARLEGLAEAGGICISNSAYEQVVHKLPLHYEDLGHRTVKNIVRPVHAYRVLVGAPSTAFKGRQEPESMAIPTIAVMPFANLSSDTSQAFLSNGITEEIITSLSKTPKMLVIGHGSTTAFQGRIEDFHQIGQDLGVQFILAGSVRAAGDHVRIHAQLVHADRGELLWAERYDRELKDIFALQDEITLRITQALQIKLTEGEQARIYGKGTDNLDAYLKWLQGQDLLVHGNSTDNELARKMFEEAIQFDPDWVQPYVLLGWVYLQEFLMGWSSSAQSSFEQAIKLSQKSLALDDSLPGPHGLMSQIYLYQRRHDAAIAEAQKAVACGPGLAYAHAWLGAALMFAGRSHDACLAMEKAIRLIFFPPPYWHRDLGEIYRLAGRYEEAILAFEKAVRIIPHYLEALVGLVCTYAQMDRIEDASQAADRILALNPDFSVGNFAKSLPFKEEKETACVVVALRKAGLT